MPTYTHSVTINPGEVFTLPPNSQILFTTDPTGLESVCAPIPTATLKCYQMHWVVNKDAEGSFSVVGGLGLETISLGAHENAWENDDGSDAPIYFTKVGGLNTITTISDTDFTDLVAVEAAINTTPISGAITNRKYKYGIINNPLFNNVVIGSDPRTGYNTYDLYFKSVDTIGLEFFLEIKGSKDNIIHRGRVYAVEIDCSVYDGITSDVSVC